MAVFLLTGDPILDQMPALIIGNSPRRKVVFDTLGYSYEFKPTVENVNTLDTVNLRKVMPE